MHVVDITCYSWIQKVEGMEAKILDKKARSSSENEDDDDDDDNFYHDMNEIHVHEEKSLRLKRMAYQWMDLNTCNMDPVSNLIFMYYLNSIMMMLYRFEWKRVRRNYLWH